MIHATLTWAAWHRRQGHRLWLLHGFTTTHKAYRGRYYNTRTYGDPYALWLARNTGAGR